MRYILNSAVITSPGRYEYFHISPEEAKNWLQKGGYLSTIGYPETADALELMTGISVAVNRQQITMQPGDEALVFRLTKRLNLPENKGKVGVSVILNNCEIGILRRIL